MLSCATPGTTNLVTDSFSVTPYPLCVNQNVCASGTCILLTDVIAPVKLAISGKFLGRVVYTDNQDLCAITEAAGLPCPIPMNTTSITACALVKPSAPRQCERAADRPGPSTATTASYSARRPP
ncbi:hypothetical protein CPB97_008612 [Podila verticillata]|nr:hypothetical protein CPB97_008612 [Podila verticillata]